MKRIYFLFLSLILIGLAGEVWAVPPLPQTFYGTVKKDGANVPDGTVVSAWIGGVTYAYTNTITSGADSVYTFNLPGDDQETPAKEGGVAGEIISFKVGGQTAGQTAVYSSGGATQLNITIISPFNLGISINPPNSGSVSKNPDKSVYNSGEQVSLTATGIPGYIFSNWSGGASGTTNPITVTMDAHKAVTANFTQDQYTLTVSVSPTGKGSVTKSPDKSPYAYGELVTLTAVANPGYTFSGWSGDASGTSSPITVTVNGNKSVTASFAQDQYGLTVSVNPPGEGSVTKSPDKATYAYGDQVQLTAVANPGYTFSGWSEGASGTTNPVTITMDGNKAVTASFTQDQYGLAVSMSPKGKGSVTKNPNQSTYVYGDQVQLTAVANPGYTFSGWSQDAGGTANTIAVTMHGNKAVTANFTQDQYSLTVSVTPSGAGSVTKNPNQAINVHGDQVQLTATANPGYTFSGWIGDAGGTISPIMITMNADKTVTANFTTVSDDGPGQGGPTVAYTVMTSPAGRSITVDGLSCNAPCIFNWVPNSTHTLSVSSPQSGTPGTRFVFSSWNDGGGQDHTITAPSTSTTFTANFTTQYSLTTGVNPAGAGTVSPSGTNWFNSGYIVAISATAGSEYGFSGWSGDLTGSVSPASLTMRGPKTVTAQLTAILLTTISCPDGGIQCLERVDGGDDSDNLSNGKPKVDLEYEFKVVVHDRGGTPEYVKLFMAQRSEPDPADFYGYDMSCSGDYKTGATCTYLTMLGPAAVHKFYFKARMSDGTIFTYPDGKYFTGPQIHLLRGYNLVGIPRDINNALLDGLQALGSPDVYRWEWDVKGGYYDELSTSENVMSGEGYLMYASNTTLNELPGFPEVQAHVYTYLLKPGLNCVSNPYSGNVRLSEVKIQKGTQAPVLWQQAVDNGWVVDALYYYNGEDWGDTYSHMTAEEGATFVPWLGYWLNLHSTDEDYYLVIPKP